MRKIKNFWINLIKNYYLNYHFLKYLKQEDLIFIKSLIEGDRILLYGMESAQPELFERIISLCNFSNPSLNLYKKGAEYIYSKNSENEKYKIQEYFRLL